MKFTANKYQQHLAEKNRTLGLPEKSYAEKVSEVMNAQPMVASEPIMYPVRLYNKLEANYHLSNKKALFLNMKSYYEALG